MWQVAYEVLRRLAETRGDFAQAARMDDSDSKKPVLAGMIRQASLKGDTALANRLSTLRFDPTSPDTPVREWDVSGKVRFGNESTENVASSSPLFIVFPCCRLRNGTGSRGRRHTAS